MSYTATIPFSTTADGDSYFAARLYSSSWSNANDTDKLKALVQATDIINRFNFIGRKTDCTQLNSWPRQFIMLDGNQLDPTIIPIEIIIAQFEIALALLSGVNIEKEIRNLRMTSRGFASVRATYDPRNVPEHLLNGVPSATAWDYLSPFFNRQFEDIRISRVS